MARGWHLPVASLLAEEATGARGRVADSRPDRPEDQGGRRAPHGPEELHGRGRTRCLPLRAGGGGVPTVPGHQFQVH